MVDLGMVDLGMVDLGMIDLGMVDLRMVDLGDGRPEDGRPGDGRPEDGRPGDGRPEDGRPGDGRPEDGRPDLRMADMLLCGRPEDCRGIVVWFVLLQLSKPSAVDGYTVALTARSTCYHSGATAWFACVVCTVLCCRLDGTSALTTIYLCTPKP